MTNIKHFVPKLKPKSYNRRISLYLIIVNFLALVFFLYLVNVTNNFGFSLKTLTLYFIYFTVFGGVTIYLININGPHSSVFNRLKNLIKIENDGESIYLLIIYELSVQDNIFYVESFLTLKELKDKGGNAFDLRPVFKTNKYYSIGLPKIKTSCISYKFGVYFELPEFKLKSLIRLDSLLSDRYFIYSGLDRYETN